MGMSLYAYVRIFDLTGIRQRKCFQLESNPDKPIWNKHRSFAKEISLFYTTNIYNNAFNSTQGPPRRDDKNKQNFKRYDEKLFHSSLEVPYTNEDTPVVQRRLKRHNVTVLKLSQIFCLEIG